MGQDYRVKEKEPKTGPELKSFEKGETQMKNKMKTILPLLRLFQNGAQKLARFKTNQRSAVACMHSAILIWLPRLVLQWQLQLLR